jgi:two-component system, chemotaxis family, chemotaxis protein CheY
MKTLIVEDDFTSRVLLQEILQDYGPTHVAVNGTEAVNAVRDAISAQAPYDLVCLDIMLPEKDGHEVLREVKSIEEEFGILPGEGVKIAMTTALDDNKSILSAFREQCDAYLIKPLDKSKLIAQLRQLSLLD